MDIEEMLKDANTPTLTLDPLGEQAAAAQAAAQAAPELVGVGENNATAPEQPPVELSPEEQKMVDEFAKQIDISNAQVIMQYGSASQKKIADFSEGALSNVRTKDMGAIGDMLTEVLGQLRSIEDPEEAKGLKGLFHRTKSNLAALKARYDKAEVNVDKIASALEGHQIQLMKDVQMLDQMYELNLAYFRELSLYIIAGKKKIQEAKEVELPALLKKAEESGLPEDVQKARDYSQMINRFEKKIYDLELTRTIALQMAPQIRLIQSNDTEMADKIQSTLVNTIPLWKSQMVIAIGLQHSTQAAAAQRQVSDMTNELLKKNAEQLKVATLETAKESERGIVDVETLSATNKTLIDTLDEVLKIQEEGRTKRASAEVELQRIENEMRAKLIEMAGK